MNPEIDKSGGRREHQSAYASKLLDFMEENNFADVWRILNPDVKRFTWRHSSRNGLVQSRLDF